MESSHTKSEPNDVATEDLSTAENKWGVDIERAEPIGKIGLFLGGFIFLYGIYWGMTSRFWVGVVIIFIGSLIGTYSYIFQKTEKEYAEWEQKQNEKRDSANGIPENKILVCRECHTEVSKGVNRCPHCGYHPKKKSGLYKGTAGVLSLSPLAPVGWIMGKRAVQDGSKSRKGVGKETTPDGIETETESVDQDTEPVDDPITSLERLDKLREQGVITEHEFEEQKRKLLDMIE